MSFIGVVIAALLFAAVGYWWQSRRRAMLDTSRLQERVRHEFAAVEIRVGAAACDAARILAGERFLANEAPSLPLSGCTEPRCRCAFAKLSDRREESRRWADDGLAASVFSASERREHSERRDSD